MQTFFRRNANLWEIRVRNKQTEELVTGLTGTVTITSVGGDVLLGPVPIEESATEGLYFATIEAGSAVDNVRDGIGLLDAEDEDGLLLHIEERLTFAVRRAT